MKSDSIVFFESFIYERKHPKDAPRYIIIYHRQAVWCGEDTELSGHLQMMVLSQTFANVEKHKIPAAVLGKKTD